MAPPRRSSRLKATTPASSSSAPLKAAKKESAAKKKTSTTTTKNKASSSSPAPSTSSSSSRAVKKEKEAAAAAPAPAPAAAAPARSKRAPPPPQEAAAKKKKAPTAAAAAAAKKKKKRRTTPAAARGPTREMEQALWREGFPCVIGVDEAGRGPLSGPVVAAACFLPEDLSFLPAGIVLDDSKKMTEEQREAAFDALERAAREGLGVGFATTFASPRAIDDVNILEATMYVMDRAVINISRAACGAPPNSSVAMRGGPDCLVINPMIPLAVLVDGNRLPPRLSQMDAMMNNPAHLSLAASGYRLRARAVIKGDAKSTAIAAASIVAKVTRDRVMRDAAEKWPEYGFEQHKGYGTAAHVAAIRKHGPCEIHRRSFEPIKSMVGWSRGGEGE